MNTARENPARYHPNIIEALRGLLPRHVPTGSLVYDPFAGDGQRLGTLCDQLGLDFRGGDLEDWQGRDPRVSWGADATGSWSYPPRQCPGRQRRGQDPRSWWAVVTSPTYNNGVNDHFEPKDDSYRMTYRVAAGHALHAHNTGRYSGRGSVTGEQAYWRLHREAVRWWPNLALVNVKDSIRDQAIYPLVDKWADLLGRNSYQIAERLVVPCPGNRRGANGQARVDNEEILVACRSGKA